MNVERRAARDVASGLVLLALAGCGWGGGSAATKPAEKPFRDVGSISVATLGDPAAVEVVDAQRGEWQGSRGADVAVRHVDGSISKPLSEDVLIFPGERLGELVDARALAVMPESVVQPSKPTGDGPSPSDSYAFSDVVPAYRDEVTKYGDDRMALPLGGSALVLAYRRDAFEGEANVVAAKADGLALEPPKTWADLDRLARFFQDRDWDGDGSPNEGIAVTSVVEVWLNRAASSGLRLDQYSFLFDADSMAPRITLPPFVEALEAVGGWKSNADAAAARAAFRGGKAALLIDRAELAPRWTDPKRPMSVGVAALPGSEKVYDPDRKVWETLASPNRPTYLPSGGGWLVGVSAGTSGRRREAAIDFALYLTSPETTARILADRTLPMLPVRSAQFGMGLPDPRSAPGVDGQLWARAVGETLQAARVVPGLRMPKAEEYLADLGRATTSDQPAQSVLETAASAWSQRVKASGLERQRWHYRRSLNKLPTPAEPPASPEAR